MFYFQDVNEVNGIHVPSIIRIQTPFQLQSMVRLSINATISMDATFNTNDVKFHLFTLMVFDAHYIEVPITWTIRSCQLVMIWWNGNSFGNKGFKEEK